MELKIYDKQGIVKMTVSPDNSSQWNHEVGVENVVTVNFTTWEFLVLEVGWYILVEGQRFSIKSEYRPKHIHDTKYTYNLKFYGREHDAQDILFCRLNQGEDDLESVFAYDGTPMDFLQKVVANMNRNTDGVVWKAGEAISANRQTINFNGLYCWDALSEIARAFGTEWWMDGEYLNISKCERGESVSLGYGHGLKSGLTQNENTNAVKWFTRLIPVGSSKNIDKSKYGYATLQLPGRDKYIDINTQYGLKEYREEAAFSEIYPHRVGNISSVRYEAKIDDQGEEYLIYYVKDTELPFNPDNYMLPGEVIHMSFNSGNLAGKEFEVNWNNSTEEFEIINQYPEYVDQLPGGNLIPSSGNQYVLSNISMPDEYNTIAEEAYQSAVDKYIQEYDIDISIYSGVTDYIYISKNNISLYLGKRVNLISKRYFDSGSRGSRITRISRKLNNLSEMTLECSNTISSTWKQTLDSSINNTIVNQQKTQVKTDKNEKDISQISGLWELKKTEDGVEYLYTKFNVLTALGFTSYSIGKEKRFPSIYDGLPIDMDTIYWELDENGNNLCIKAKVGECELTLGGLLNVGEWADQVPLADRIMVQKAGSEVWEGMDIANIGTSSFENIEEYGEGNAFTSFLVSTGEEGEKLYLIKDKTFVEQSYLEENYFTKDDASELFVTVDNVPQDIEGVKNFIGELQINGCPIEYDSTYKYWKFTGDLVVTGGIASFSSDTARDFASIMDGVVVDGRTIINEGGILMLNPELTLGGEGGGEMNTVAWGNIQGKPTTIKGYGITDAYTKTEADELLEKKWTTDNAKIQNWDTAFGWGDHNKAGYATKKYVDDTFVTIGGNTVQNITGAKNFTGGLQVNGCPIVYDAQKKYWKLEGDLLITGGIASFSSDMAYDPISIMDGILTDGVTIRVNETTKKLEVIGGGSGGGLNETQVRKIVESYNYLTSVPVATSSVKGIASFSSDFSISDGHVSFNGAKVKVVGASDPMNESGTLYIVV